MHVLRHMPNCSLALLLLAVVTVSGLSAPAQAARAWRTTHFEIFFGKPHPLKDEVWHAYRAVDDSFLPVDADPDIAIPMCNEDNQHICDSAKVQLERFLHDYAVALQNDGFADPTANLIDSIVEDENGREVVRVYLYDMGAAPLGAFTGPCDKLTNQHGQDVSQITRRVLVLNKYGTFTGSRVGPEGFQNAAHELFHGVQFASVFRQGDEACDVAKWITEGTADAVGFDYVKRLLNLEPGNLYRMDGDDPLFDKPFGLRKYYEILSKDWPQGVTDNYRSSSFWRHLAELYHAKKRGVDHPGSGKAPVDYSYLPLLFARPYSSRSELNDLRRIDSFMKSRKEFSSGLAPVFAQFMATIADFMDSRIPPINGLSGGDRQRRWLEWLFEPCAKVRLSTTSPKARAHLKIDAVAARCVSVEVGTAGSAPLEVVIENSDLSVDKQKQIRIGVIGGEIVQVADVRIAQLPARDAGQNYAKWHFVVVPGVKNIFVFSNLAAKAQETRIASGDFHFSIPSWQSSMTEQDNAAPGATGGGQPKSREAARQYQRDKRRRPTTRGLAAGMVGVDRKAPDPGCTGELQARNICGPQLSISLSRDFGILGPDAPAASAGGMMKQLGEISASSGNEQSDQLELAASMQRVAGQRGNLVTLSIPVVDYGWSGSVDNARVSVSGGDSGSYVAVATTPDDDGLRPPTGNVTVAEYTPHILRGHFSAALVSQQALKNATRQNPTVPVAENIEGTFVVSAPWRGSAAAPDAGPDSALMIGMREDMTDFLLKMPEEMRSGAFSGARLRELCRLGFEDEQLASLGINGSCEGSGGAAALGMPRCACDCQALPLERDIPLCQDQCSARWQALTCEAPAADDAGGWDGETDRYASELRLLGVEGSNYDLQTRAFAAAGAARRTQMWSDLDILRGVLAEEGAQTMQQARAQEKARSTPEYDAETMQYKAALEQAGQPPEVVHGMVTVFATSPPQVRQVFWDEIGNLQP